MKEGGGGDHVSVGVRKPRSRRIRPISKKNIFIRPPRKQIIIYIAPCLSLLLNIYEMMC